VTKPLFGAESDEVVRLVLGVARLGEASLRGWWQSHGLDQAGRYVLAGAFPRTWRCAALELAIASAKRRHEEMLPRATALHLFSDHLPFRRLTNAWLSEQKTAGDTERLDALAAWTTDVAEESLRDWTAAAAASGERVGSGLLLGRLTSEELQDPDLLLGVARQLAAGYADQSADFAAPYFDLAP
jgi:hypothetical protein